jgi:hypothetical protein
VGFPLKFKPRKSATGVPGRTPCTWTQEANCTLYR